jgi:hypothetical protein
MTSRLNRIGRRGCPAVIIGALALLSAGISGAQPAPASNLAAALLERHFQHEDTLYATKDGSVQTPTQAAAMALHFEHEDRIYGGSQEMGAAPLSAVQMLDRHFRHEDALYAAHPYSTPSSTPQRIGVPSYTPAMLAAHFNREDRLYQPRPPLPANPSTIVSRDFDWTDWAIGLGSGIALILALGGVLAFALQRRHRVQAA